MSIQQRGPKSRSNDYGTSVGHWRRSHLPGLRLVLGPLRRALEVVRHSQLSRQVAPLWGAEGVVLITGLVQALVVARILGPREYGLVALSIAAPTLLFTFFDPQAYESVVRYVTRFLGEGDPDRAAAVPRLAYAADSVLALAGLTLAVAVAPWAAENVLKAPSAADLVVVYAIGLCAAAPLSTSRAVLTSFDRFRLIGRVASSAAVFRMALVLLLVGLGWGASGVIYGSMIGLLLEGILMGVIADRAMRTATGRSWRSARMKHLGTDRRPILSFMLHTELSSLAGALVKHADVVILGAARGPQAAGIYRLAWQLVAPVTRIAVPLQQVIYPRAARLAAAADGKALRALIRRQTTSVGVPLAALVLAAIPMVVVALPRLAGRDYGAAAAPVAFLLVGAAVAVALFWVRPVYLATGLVLPLLVVSTMAAAVSVAGFLVAAPLGGPAGVAAVRALLTGLVGGGASAAYLLRRMPRIGVAPAANVPQEAAV